MVWGHSELNIVRRDDWRRGLALKGLAGAVKERQWVVVRPNQAPRNQG
jgi:hypothetical protein